MLQAVIEDGGASSVSEIARNLRMPVATAHRQVTSLAEFGFLAATGSGRYGAGPNLVKLTYRIDRIESVVALVHPIVDELAQQLGTTVHLGSFEGEMVTYRAKAGDPKNGLFTEVGGQLEAYCSGIGKVLLAHLPDEELAAYLANGPFYALTVNTITDAGALSAELKRVRAEGMAFDREEVEDGLNCVAVPLFVPDGSVPLALSASFRGAIANARILSQAAARLLAAKASIEALFATP